VRKGYGKYPQRVSVEKSKPQNHNLHLSPEQGLVLQDELRRLIRWNINPDLEFICGLIQAPILRWSVMNMLTISMEMLLIYILKVWKEHLSCYGKGQLFMKTL